MRRTNQAIGALKMAMPVLFILLVATLLMALGCQLSGFGIDQLRASAKWLDPMFFMYNLALAILGMLILPTITWLYVRTMKSEKTRRLERDIPTEDMSRYRPDVVELLERQFRFKEYWASVITTTIVVGAGASIILLLKPCFPAQAGGAAGTVVEAVATAASPVKQEVCNGVDYGRGANFLLLGPFLERYDTDRKGFYHQIAISLTAFQFGFLGAYIYFLGSLTRAYFILDLSSNTFVAGTVRMVTSSFLALVISFAIPSHAFGRVADAVTNEGFLRLLPFLSFFIGYFPDRGFLILEEWGSRTFGLKSADYRVTPMSRLAGMSLAHQVRLGREGYDNLENLSHARPVELAVRTGFSYRQLKHWIGEAMLRGHMGQDYEEFFKCAGISTADELERYWESEPPTGETLLKSALEPRLFAKTKVVELLIHTRPRSVQIP